MSLADRRSRAIAPATTSPAGILSPHEKILDERGIFDA
jgi:hypothetical protein